MQLNNLMQENQKQYYLALGVVLLVITLFAANRYFRNPVNYSTSKADSGAIKIVTDIRPHTVPHIFGPYIVWPELPTSFSKGTSENIMLYDLATNKIRSLTSSLPSGMRYETDIHRNRVAWFEVGDISSDDNKNIFMTDLLTNQIEQLSFGPNDDEFPKVSDNYIVWNNRTLNQLKVFDFYKKTTQIVTSDLLGHEEFAVSGDWVAWVNRTNFILARNLQTGEQRELAQVRGGNNNIDMDYGRVVWNDSPNGNLDIFMYDFSNGRVAQLTNNPANQSYPRISGRYVSYSDDSKFDPSTGSHPDVFLYDISTATDQRITDTGDASAPDIDQNRIIFLRENDIYMYEITDTQPPTVPANFQAIQFTSATTSANVRLSWQASTDNVGVSGYNVFRDGAVITALGPSATSLDVFQAVGSTRIYAVSAFDAAGNQSAQSNKVTITTQWMPTPPAIISFFSNNSNGINATTTLGQITSLIWKVSGDPFPTISINNGIGVVTGSSVNVSPKVTTTYILTAANSAGTATSSITVTVVKKKTK